MASVETGGGGTLAPWAVLQLGPPGGQEDGPDGFALANGHSNV